VFFENWFSHCRKKPDEKKMIETSRLLNRSGFVTYGTDLTENEVGMRILAKK
jgi:hypothetical protein